MANRSAMNEALKTMEPAFSADRLRERMNQSMEAAMFECESLALSAIAAGVPQSNIRFWGPTFAHDEISFLIDIRGEPIPDYRDGEK